MTARLISLNASIIAKTAARDKFISNQADYFNHVNLIFSNFEYELVMYDEQEYFKKFNDDEFFYPY
jgi:hypothetical protein